MKNICLLCILCLLSILFSCKKNIDKVPGTANKEMQDRIAPNYFVLPPNGKEVNFKTTGGRDLSLYQVDSIYILEFDMALRPWQVEKLKASNGKDASRTYTTDFIRYWPSGVVPYVFDLNITQASQNTILNAMADWEFLVGGGIDFVPRTNQADYIRFVASGNNVSQSSVGRVGGMQSVLLAQPNGNPVSQTSTEHELGHALGLFHEQSRGDRNNFITIDFNNVKPAMAYNFNFYDDQNLGGTEFGTFDFNSIMLYPSFITDASVVFNTSIPTMTRLNGTTWGFNFFISSGDVETIQLIYGPPFARLRNVLYYSDETWNTSDVIMDVYMDFYADAQLTTPFNLQANRNVNVDFVTFTNEYANGAWHQTEVHNVTTHTFTAGNNSFYLGQMRNYEERDGTFNPIYNLNQWFNVHFQGFR